ARNSRRSTHTRASSLHKQRQSIMGKLDNKIAIVIGAGQGIGRGIAEKFGAEGATVVVTDMNETTATETAEAIRAAGLASGVMSLSADVTSRESVQRMVERVQGEYGRIDALI